MPNAFTRRIGAKRSRQYEHIKAGELARGRSLGVAKRIAAATVNAAISRRGKRP